MVRYRLTREEQGGFASPGKMC